MALPDHPRTASATQAARAGAGMTEAHGDMARGRGGDGDGLPAGAPNAQMNAVSGAIPLRRQAHGVRKYLNPPRKSLTPPRDEETLTFDAPARSWECSIWEMSVQEERQ